MNTALSSNALSRRSFVALAAGGLAAASAGRAAAAGAAGTRTDDAAGRAPQGGGYYTFGVGKFVCHSLGDADFELATSPTWGDGSAGDDADIAAVLAYDFKKADAVRAYVQPLVIETGKGRVLVDTGNGPRPDASGNASSRLRTTLAAAGLKASDIDVVVLTHLHGDHTGGLLDEKGQELFAKAEYVVHAAELDFWSSGTPDLSKTPRLPDGWKQSIAKGAKQAADLIAPRARRVADGDEIVEGIKVMHLPGHTPGMIGLVVGSGDAQLMVANDVVHHDTLSLRRPLMPVMFDADVAQGARTRQAFLTRAAAERALVFSYHMPFPAVGRVRAEGGAFAWVAEGWKW